MSLLRERPIVAIDGPAGVGKSTVARAVARRLGYTYIDTGAMYRSVALRCLECGVAVDSDGAADVARETVIEFGPLPDGSQRVTVCGSDVTEAIREHSVSNAASVVSAQPEVRRLMVERQRAMGEGGGVVMEGRDIQTNVFPDAEVKVFLSASAEERARRRAGDLADRGMPVPPIDELARSIAERDNRDATRDTAPMMAAPDAHTIDTDGMTIDEVVAAIESLARSAEGGASDGQE